MTKIVPLGGEYKAAFNLLGQPDFMRKLLGDNQNPRDGAEAYLASPTAKAALKVRVDAIAQPELCLYDGNDNKIESHEILSLLATVNEDLNYSDLMKYTEACQIIYPFSIWLKGRETISGQGRVRKLFPVNPSSVTIQPIYDASKVVTDYYFQYQPTSGKGQRLEKKDVVFFKSNFNPNSDIEGLSPLAGVRNACLAEKYVSWYLNTFFENGAMPGIVFSSENPIGTEDTKELEDKFSARFRGVRNFFKTLFVLGNGLKPFTIGGNNKDLDLAIVREVIEAEICKAVSVPVVLINQNNTRDLTPVEQAQSIFWNSLVKPELSWYAEVLNNQLITEYPDLVTKGAYFEFEIDEIIKSLSFEISKKNADVREDYKLGLISDIAARRELGYTEEDAPIAEAVQPVATGTVQAMPMMTGTSQPMPAVADMPMKNIDIELERWERKAVKALKDGKSPAVKFESDTISAIEHARISTALEQCTTVEEIKAVFSVKSEVKPEDLLNALVELTRVVREHGSDLETD